MSERIKPPQKPEITKELLMETPCLEKLILSERIPIVQEIYAGGRNYSTLEPMEKKFLVIVPPEGTRLGDIMTYVSCGRVVFSSPRNETRGLADLMVLSDKEAEQLKARVNQALKALEIF